MTEAKKANVALITCGPKSRSHYASLGALVLDGVVVDIETLDLYSNNLYAIENKKEIILERTKDLVQQRKWDGVMMVAAPTEVLNPGLFAALRASLDVPVTTALDACVAALRAFAAQRVLLLTPFDARLNDLIRNHLENRGVVAIAPRPFQRLGDALKLTPQEVFEHTARALRQVGPVDAVYFQGAVLDPLKILGRIEYELGTPVIASNPAMLWSILSKLELSYPIEGYGKLLRDWPALR